MATCVLWIDSVQAKVFRITTSEIDRKTIKSGELSITSEEKFFQDVTMQIDKADTPLLIMGGGPAKNRFKEHLQKKKHESLLKNLRTVETLGELTDKQILKVSRRYFRKYNFAPLNGKI